MYDAAAEPGRLGDVVARLARHFKSHVGGLRIYDSGYSKYTYFESVGMTPTEWTDFDASCDHCNVWRRAGYKEMLQNGFGHSETILPRRELIKTAFYNDYTRPLDIDHGMGLCLWTNNSGQMTSISLNRSHRAGVFSMKELECVKFLLPHFRSAYAIMRRLSWLETRAATFATAIDRLHVGLLLVDSEGSCEYRNQAADLALSSRRGVWLSAGDYLRCADPQTQARLLEAVALAAAGKLPAPRRIFIRDPQGELSYVFTVAMLRGELSRLCAQRALCASIFIHYPSAPEQNAAEILQQAFVLTPAETRLAILVVDGTTIANCAEVLGVGMTTIRTQLRSLFAKTHTRRQAELALALSAVLRAS
jgi:DNA-binding CsgD family transcriptional regulator